MNAIRRKQLLDQANQTDHDVVKKLAAMNDQLERQQADLEQEEQQQQALRDTLDGKLAAVQQQQAETSQLVSELQTRLATQIAIVAFADATRKAQLEAERATLSSRSRHRGERPGGPDRRQPGSGPVLVPGAGRLVQRRLRRPRGTRASTCSCRSAPRRWR